MNDTVGLNTKASNNEEYFELAATAVRALRRLSTDGSEQAVLDAAEALRMLSEYQRAAGSTSAAEKTLSRAEEVCVEYLDEHESAAVKLWLENCSRVYSDAPDTAVHNKDIAELTASELSEIIKKYGYSRSGNFAAAEPAIYLALVCSLAVLLLWGFFSGALSDLFAFLREAVPDGLI